MNEEQLKKIQELLEKIRKQAEELGREFPFADDPRFQSEETLKAIEDYGKAFDELNNQAESFADLLDGINNDLGGIAAAITATIQELGTSSEGYNNIRNALRGIGRVARDLKLDQEDIVKLSEKQLQSLDKRLQQNIALYEINQAAIEQRKQELQEEIGLTEQEQRRGAILSKQELKQLDKKKKELGDILTAERIINDEIAARNNEVEGLIDREKTLSQILEARIQQRRREEAEISGATAQAKTLSDLLSKIPLIGPAAKESFKDLDSEVRKIREETGKIPEDFNSTLVYLRLLGKRIGGLIPLFAISQLAKALKEVDATAGSVAKQFNLTYFEAQRVRQEFAGIAGSSGEIFVTSKGILETLSAINQTLGTRQFTNLSNDFQDSLVFLTKLREQAGLTNEELVGISQLVLSTGESAEAITAEFLAQAQISSARQGVLVNEKELFREIKNLSAATLLSLQRSPAAIADAAATAKALGLELSQVERIADGLLQFESSITSELEAELLIGRNLNLERARFAALNNDIATVAKEIAEQAGSAAEFAKLNRIQQQALADAVMMSREELGSQLLIQEQLGTLTGEEADRRRAVIDNLIAERGLQGAINVLGQESIETLERQASVADEFNAIIMQLKEAFVSVATALAPIGKVLSYVGIVIKGLLNPVQTLVSLFDDLGETAQKVASIVDRLLTGAGIGALIGGGIGTLLGPGVGTVAGAKVGALIGGSLTGIGEAVTYAADDIYLPNKSQYGETTIKAPEGTFKLNEKDKAIIAGTDGSFRDLNSISEPIVNKSQLTQQKLTEESKSTEKPLKRIIDYIGSVNIGSKFEKLPTQPSSNIGSKFEKLPTQPSSNIGINFEKLLTQPSSNIGINFEKIPTQPSSFDKIQKEAIKNEKIASFNTSSLKTSIIEKINKDIVSIRPNRERVSGQTYAIANESMFNPISNINTANTSNINNSTQNLDLKELIDQNRKLIEATENQTRVLARESEMTRKSKQKLQVGVQDFGTDVNMFSSRVEFG